MINLREFPESRYRHCYSVGKKMYWYSKKGLGWSEDRAREMFVLGNLHDIGYEFDGDSFKHNEALYEILRDTYEYDSEIKYHSKLQDKYSSVELQLLYFADSTVDGMGNWCTYEERLNDMATRYGKDSKEYNETAKIIEKLKEWGFNDSLRLG